jgi:O-acetyl-ADP-ribose deacetylase (regulator of RNase III)
MPFEIVRNDIVNMQVDAIVNTANPRPVIGSGTDAGIHAKAGPKLLEARQKIGNIQAGCSAITGGYGLDADYVIHTVGPIFSENKADECKSQLESCYKKSLELAQQNNCKSVAFPLISAGVYGYPKKQALQVAVDMIQMYGKNLDVEIVLFDKEAWGIAQEDFGDLLK